MGVIAKFCLLSVLIGGCSKTIAECEKDSDCTNIVYPFCDADGEYAASGGVHGVCTIVPPDCKVDRCGCAAGATACSGSALTTCNSDQMSVTTVDCALGCAASSDRCSSFKPSNGLDAAMNAATEESDVVLPDHVTVDTDRCEDARRRNERDNCDQVAANRTDKCSKNLRIRRGFAENWECRGAWRRCGRFRSAWSDHGEWCP